MTLVGQFAANASAQGRAMTSTVGASRIRSALPLSWVPTVNDRRLADMCAAIDDARATKKSGINRYYTRDDDDYFDVDRHAECWTALC